MGGFYRIVGVGEREEGGFAAEAQRVQGFALGRLGIECLLFYMIQLF